MILKYNQYTWIMEKTCARHVPLLTIDDIDTNFKRHDIPILGIYWWNIVTWIIDDAIVWHKVNFGSCVSFSSVYISIYDKK